MQQLKKFITQLVTAGLSAGKNLLLPTCCSHCKKILTEQTIFCNQCLYAIRPIVSTSLSLTRNYAIPVVAIADYCDPLRSLILAKHRSDIIASRYLGQLIWQLTHIKSVPADYIIPVPLHWTRYAWRGFNQAEEIAHTLARKRKIPVIHAVRRIKKTHFQARLSAQHRHANVDNAFVLNTSKPERYYNKHLIIVDDLMTTGATLQSLAKILRILKPASIIAVVACRALTKSS